MDDKTPARRRLPIVSDEPDAPADAKRLMNEVLPAPTREGAPAPARQRTLERMARLMAIAAASTAIQAKCGEHAGVPAREAGPDPQMGYAVVDPMPPPAPDVVAPDAAGPIPVEPVHHETGYNVVDPLPPPPLPHDHHGARRRGGAR
jgi:hypothetical protein